MLVGTVQARKGKPAISFPEGDSAMGYLVYEMEAIKELRGQDRERVTEVRRQLEQTRVLEASPFIPHLEALGHNFFKKRLEKQRLIAYRMDVEVSGGLVPVVILLELLHRDDPRYGSGSAEHFEDRYGDLIRYYRQEIQKFAEGEVTRRQLKTLQPLVPLPDSLRALLDPVIPGKDDTMIFHSALWLRQYRSLEVSGDKNSVFEALEQIYNELHKTTHNHGEWTLKQHGPVTVHYIPIYNPENYVARIFVLGFITSSWQEERRKDAESRICELLDKLQHCLAKMKAAMSSATEGGRTAWRDFWDQISAHSRIAYPGYLLADQGLWERVVAAPEISLALSQEEASVLESLLAGERFPAIVEGRAGSGKTTLLNFFVPERVIRRPSSFPISETRQHKLLYLTQSEALLRKGQEQMEKLRQYLRERLNVDEFLEVEFLTFHKFALNQLPQERRARFFDRSPQKGWIGFYEFRKLLRDPGLGLRQRLSGSINNPEILWFVLRSYIKGFYFDATDEDRWMTPEQYASGEDLPKKDQQVSQEVFQEIWEKVWPWYKRLTIPCEENDFSPEFWDDLDLAWEVLLHRSADAPLYAIIVCDEVQDFSRVELAAVFQSLEFLKYHRDPQTAAKLPIVLAGDSYQTVNPAYFRWARLKGDCAEVVIRRTPEARVGRIEPFQLTYNYRSQPTIGRLCNALQFLRQEMFDVAGELQRIWTPEEEQPNQSVRRLIIDPSAGTLQSLLREGVLGIGPEPADTSDPRARQFWQKIGLPEGPPKDSIYRTPADLKGLEEEYVALVGFGTAFQLLDLRDFWTWDSLGDMSQIREADRFAAEYFLNRLYVAVSRARQQLWIIETQEGWEAFWEKLSDWISKHRQSGSIEQTWELISEPWWTEGGAEEICSVFKGQFEKLAEKFLERAKDTRNPEDAKSAAFYFGRTDNSLKQREAQAWQWYLSGDEKKAAEFIAEVDPQQATDWLWEARVWSQFLRRADKADQRKHIAKAMETPPSSRGPRWVRDMAENVKACNAQVQQCLSQYRRSWSTWGQILTELLEAASELPLEEAVAKRRAREVIEPYKDAPYEEPRRFHWAFAKLSYQLGEFDSAVKHWEKAGETQHRDYFAAKAQTVEYPEKLRWLESAGDWDQIVRLFESRRGIPLSREDRQRVLRACTQMNRLRQAVILAATADGHEFRKLWMSLVGNQTISDEELISLTRQAYDALSQAIDYDYGQSPLAENQREREQNIRDELHRRWSELLLDVALDLLVRSSDHRESKRNRIWQPILRGLSHGNWPVVFIRRLEEASKKRDEEESRTWELYRELLDNLFQHGLNQLNDLWEIRDYEAAANLSYFLMALVWDKDTPHKDAFLGATFWRVKVRDYLRFTQFLENQPSFLSDVAPEFHAIVRKSVLCVAQKNAPADIVRSLDPSRWWEFRELVNGLGYLFVNEAQHIYWEITGPPTREMVSWFEPMGELVLRAPFRKLAVKFFETLKDAVERWQLALNVKGWIEIKRQKAVADQRDYIESRKEIRVSPGKYERGRYLHVRSLDFTPEVIFEVPPRYEQIRLAIELPSRKVHFSVPASVGTQNERGRESGGLFRWKGFTADGYEIDITWDRNDKYVVAEIVDERYRIELAWPEP
jgi:hypothetical protein